MPNAQMLSPTITVSTNQTQAAELAIDVGPYKSIVIQVKKSALATAGTLYIQHGLRKLDEYFVDISSNSNFDLSTSGIDGEIIAYENPGRYLRWRLGGLSGGPVTFSIEVLAREV